MPLYNILFFDADGTLFDFARAERRAIGAVLESAGAVPSDELAALYSRENDALWKAFERGEITKSALQVGRFEIFFKKAGVTGLDPREANERYLAAFRKGSDLVEGAEELCRTLHGRFPLVLVTNGVAASQRARLAGSRIAPYIDHMMVSEEIGFAKPDRRYFEGVFSRLGLGEGDKKRVLVVGDSLTADIAGARAFGLDSCYYNPTGAPLPQGSAPTYEIALLGELPGLLGMGEEERKRV